MITDENLLNNKKKYLFIIIPTVIVIIGIIILIIVLKNRNYILINLDENNICNTNIYDGTPKKLTNIESNEQYTVSNNEATEVGEYSVTIKPNKGYAWNNKSRKEKKVICTIKKSQTIFNINKEKITLSKEEQTKITIESNVEGNITIESDDNIINIKEGKKINKTKDNLTITITGINEGTTKLKTVFTPNDTHYETITKETEVTINNYKKVTPPTSNVCKKTKYNGQTQKLVNKTDYEGYTLKGQTEGKEIGSYKIEAVLKNGYIWSDGSNSNKEIKCSIEKDPQYAIKVASTSCIAGEKTYVTIESKIAHNKWSEDGVENIKNNTNITKIEQVLTCGCTTFKGYTKGYSICPNCVYKGRYNISCLKPGTDTITFTTDNKETLTTTITVKKGDTIKLGNESQWYDGISCTEGKEITILTKTLRDGVESNILKNFSIKNTEIATVSKSSNQPTNAGNTNLTIKCIKKGNTELSITTSNGTTKNFPIGYY